MMSSFTCTSKLLYDPINLLSVHYFSNLAPCLTEQYILFKIHHILFWGKNHKLFLLKNVTKPLCCCDHFICVKLMLH